MATDLAYSYARYLEAKRSVDERSINRHVLAALRAQRPGQSGSRVLDVGGGTGSMLRRCLDWDLLDGGDDMLEYVLDYVLVDRDGASLGAIPESLRHGARERGLSLQLEDSEISEYLGTGPQSFDLVIANAVLDLFELEEFLPRLWAACSPEALFWFTINFDGESCFLPASAHDDAIWHAYHESMNRRPGSRYAGRTLLAELMKQDARLLASGSSDWLVHREGSAYAEDEAYFLHHIVHTIDEELRANPPVASADFSRWIAERHAQIESAELVYMAHQLDFVGRVPKR